MTNKLPDPLYDLSLIEELGDLDIAIELVNLYLTETPLELGKLRKAVDEKDNKTAKAIAHKLKSGTQLLQVGTLSNILETIESKVEELNHGELLEKVGEAEAVYANLVVPLTNEIQLLTHTKM